MQFPKANLVILHLISWLLFFALILGFTVSMGNDRPVMQIFSLPYFIFFVVYMGFFYLNSNFLFPQLYLEKRRLAYFAVIILLLAGVMVLQPFDDLIALNRPPMREGPPPPFERPPPPLRRGVHIDIVSIILFIMVWISSSVLHIINEWRFTQQRAARAETEKARAELSFLKAQINPHFLFNTLNNIYSMAITKNEYTAASIMKLSNIMRYVTDEVSQDFVPLQNEVDCIRDYIDLQRMRLNDRAEVVFSVSGELEGISIAPLLLMAYIENVFKYGISGHEDSQILIRINAEKNAIIFFCQNKIFTTERKTERTGVGLLNTQQRLQKLYPNKHKLSITNDKNLHTVELTIETK